MSIIFKELSIKVVRIQGRGGCPVRTFCEFVDKGCSSVVDVRTFSCKNPRFFEIYLRSHGQGIEPADKRGGWSSFHDFVRTSFMDGP